MKNKGKVIYVGKAKNLSKRISSYFNRDHNDLKTLKLIKNIDDIDFILCNSERDAFLLENNLIKKYSPKYNINLKDQKTYPYIVLTKEKYPKISIIRTTKRLNLENMEYFGPYPQGCSNIKKTLIKIFKIRDCNRDMEKRYNRVCLKYHMKLCKGPCINKTQELEDEYSNDVQKIKEVLKGNSKEVIDILKKDMEKASKNMEFERAIFYREQIKEIELGIKKQITEYGKEIDEDIFTFKVIGEKLFLCVINIQDGKVLGKNFFIIDLEEKIYDNILEEIIKNYYLKYSVPHSIILEEIYEDRYELLETVFNKIFNKKIDIYFPKISSRRFDLLNMGLLNLDKEIEIYYNRKHIIENGLKDLHDKLRLRRFPYRIECFDISNIQGKDAVASMSVAIEGKKSPKNYRRFKIRCKDTPDDFEMMREVIIRRYSKLKKEEFPDIILIDGGIGQINAVGKVLEDIGKLGISELLSIAKREEEIYKYGEREPYIFSKSGEALKILQRVRDEAHRFGVTYHRVLRNKRVISSELDKINGIGEKRKKILLDKFHSVKNIKKASLEELESVIPKSVAIRIKKELI